MLSCRKSTREAASIDIYFFFDDSGVLHKNSPCSHFVYAGYVFTSREELDTAKRKYINANRAIRHASGLEGELKAAFLNATQKRALFTCIREYSSLSAAVEIQRLYPHILADKKSICRYKDYVLKLCVKRKVQDLIKTGKLSRQEDVFLHIYIDEQLTATNGYYSLKDSIIEELQYGIVNFNYGVVWPKVIDGRVQVTLEYCESKNNYLIQASDIIANRIWTSYRVGKPELRNNIPNHLSLTLP